jgi:hypothetical protein
MFLFEILELALLISQFSLLILELLFAYEPEVVDSQALVVVKADQIFFLFNLLLKFTRLDPESLFVVFVMDVVDGVGTGLGF